MKIQQPSQQPKYCAKNQRYLCKVRYLLCHMVRYLRCVFASFACYVEEKIGELTILQFGVITPMVVLLNYLLTSKSKNYVDNFYPSYFTHVSQ